MGGRGSAWEYSWEPRDDEDSIAAIRRAVEGGVNWVDTAAVYDAEEVVRQALAPCPVGVDVLVFTKCGLNWYNDSDGKTISTCGLLTSGSRSSRARAAWLAGT